MSAKPESTVGHYAKATLGVAVVVGAIAAAWVVRRVLLLIVIAFVLAIAMDPGIRFIQRRTRLGRGGSTAVILLSVLGLLVLFFSLVIPPIAHEVQLLVERAPGYLENLQRSGGWLGQLEERFQLGQQLEKLAGNAPRIAQSSLNTVVGFTGALASGLFTFFTLLVLTIYFAGSLPVLEDGISALFPPEKREEYRTLLDRVTEKIGGYASGQLTVSLIAGLSAFVAFLIIGLPFPAALAMWVSITTLIPSVGALVGAVLCVLVASFVGIGTALITAIYILVYQQVENYVISPRIMKKAVDLSPAAVIISVLIGGSLLGFVGALLALPMAAAAKIVVRELWLRKRDEPEKRRLPRRRRKPAGELPAAPVEEPT
ncbi:MAG TPA: AI-2E family transporter [Actinomycetota bacterium]|nr:AI-2E family transporter [Actinomycetota bacterium]